MFQLSQKQIARLAALGSSARFATQAGMKSGRPDADPDKAHKCELIDDLHKKVWASGFGADESAALDAALKNAQPGDRPKTPAEMARELKAYREKYGDLSDTAASPTRTPNPDAGGDDKKPEQAGDLESLSPADLRTALQARGLSVPDGDARTTTWKQAAIEAIRAADA